MKSPVATVLAVHMHPVITQTRGLRIPWSRRHNYKKLMKVGEPARTRTRDKGIMSPFPVLLGECNDRASTDRSGDQRFYGQT